jgi:hypothetical protein
MINASEVIKTAIRNAVQAICPVKPIILFTHFCSLKRTQSF